MATSISLRNPNVSLGTSLSTSLSTTRLAPRRSSNATVRLLRVLMPASSLPLATTSPSAAVEAVSAGKRPDRYGRFGRFGGKYVPETLMYALSELETAFEALSKDPEFQVSCYNCYFLTSKFEFSLNRRIYLRYCTSI
jgi:hypothetical protein